jgi:uncharacterized SAM-binding protein YcdF (DUF218 family)
MLMSILKFFINPFNIFWLLLLVTIGVWFLKKKHLFKWLVISTIIWFLLISTPLLSNSVLNSLEDRYTPLYTEELINLEAEYHIVVLGGGHSFDSRLPSNSLLSVNALGRLNEAIRLHRQLPNSKLVLSGFSASGRTTQAEMLQQAALLLGVDKTATILQNEPGNTYEEAQNYTENYGDTHPVILVTSASHMHRAVNIFRHFGTDPIPSPTDYRLKGSWKQKWIGFPTTRNIENFNVAVNEYAGIIWYHLRSLMISK